MLRRILVTTLPFIVLGFSIAFAQTTTADRLTLTPADPSHPVLVKANVMTGNIIVRGSNGRVVVVTTSRAARSENEKPLPDGMHRISMPGGLRAEQEGNTIRISTDITRGPSDLTLDVPYGSSLDLHSVSGNVSVEGVQGEVDVNAVSGNVVLRHLSGVGVVNTINGKITANFDRINSAKPMAFSSMNGDIDLTLPTDARASLSIQSFHGDVFTNLELKMEPSAPPTEVRSAGGHKIEMDRTLKATLNGGGAPIQIHSFNGSIYLRKAGSAKAAQ
jgi:hypothetical protein